jgi:hypothetical protein
LTVAAGTTMTTQVSWPAILAGQPATVFAIAIRPRGGSWRSDNGHAGLARVEPHSYNRAMPLFDLTSGALEQLDPTTFAAEGILERRDLQAAIKGNISLLGDDLLVVAEEFGSFQDAHRRIDLLCVDRAGHLVVVELKRTNDGGHMELQALRYAAMVSAFTFDDLLEAFESFLIHEGQDGSEARAKLTEWLDDGEEAELGREVRIILASADFGREITTTALWLNEVYDTDIRCVKIAPYNVAGRLLLSVEQIIPLPEAEEYTVRLRRQTVATRAARRAGQDWTRYIVITSEGSSEPLFKRRAILAMVHAIHDSGVKAAEIFDVLGTRKFRPVDGTLKGEELRESFKSAYPEQELRRWFIEDPLYEGDRTWVVSNQWGLNTVPSLEALVTLAPTAGISFEAAS